jgi:hypothetical protein
MELPLSGSKIVIFLKNCHLAAEARIFMKGAKEN